MEVRTEEERTPNHDGGKHTEPNETTPLTEPEYVVPPQQRPTPSPPAHPARAAHPQLLAKHCRPGFLAKKCQTLLSPWREGILGSIGVAVGALKGLFA